MVSTLNGCFTFVSRVSAAVLQYAVHQHFSRWNVATQGARCGLQQICVHHYCKVVRDIETLLIYKMCCVAAIPTFRLVCARKIDIYTTRFAVVYSQLVNISSHRTL